MTYEVVDRVERFHGKLFDVVTDQVTMPDGSVASRDYLRHVGAVGVVALDEQDRVLLVRQYRHAVGEVLWELPAGLLDVAGEDPVATAARELAEEADLVAAQYAPLLDMHSSPGCSSERVRLFLARGITALPEADRHVRQDEESELTTEWFDVDEAVGMALRGEITNAACLVGLFAVATLRHAGLPPVVSAEEAAEAG